jgi:very-short-patch-repair endonuclease
MKNIPILDSQSRRIRLKKSKKKNRKSKGKKHKLPTGSLNLEILEQRALRLRNSKFPSDIWLKKQWENSGLLDSEDKFNEVYYPYIPDLQNRKWKYIVESDGESHIGMEAQAKDQIRDTFFKNQKYKVFRVKHKDSIGFSKIREEILKLRCMF